MREAVKTRVRRDGEIREVSGEMEEKVCPTYARTHGHLGESKVVRESKKMSEGELARE